MYQTHYILGGGEEGSRGHHCSLHLPGVWRMFTGAIPGTRVSEMILHVYVGKVCVDMDAWSQVANL